MKVERVRRLLMQQAIEAYRANRVAAARKNLKSVLYLNPKDIEALHWMQLMRGIPDSKDDLIEAEYEKQAEPGTGEQSREARQEKPARGLSTSTRDNSRLFFGLWRWGVSTGLAVLAVLFLIAGCSTQVRNPTDFAAIWQNAARSVGMYAPALRTVELHLDVQNTDTCETPAVTAIGQDAPVTGDGTRPTFQSLRLGFAGADFRPKLMNPVQLPAGENPNPAAADQAQTAHTEKVQNAALTNEVTPIAMRAHRTSKTLEVWSGGRLIRSYPIGTGPLEYTPLGTHRVIERAVLSPVNLDGSPNPYGTRWLGFDVAGEAGNYGIHGTPDPDLLGGEETLGCLVLEEQDLQELYDMMPRGATITIDDL